MRSHLKSFEEVVSGIMDETGITDLRNKYGLIRRLTLRAVEDINPYASLYSLKRVKYYKGGPYFDGKNFKKPEDFIALNKLGCCDDGICPGMYRESISHIIFCDGKDRENIIVTYYAITCDGTGNPIVTANHYEAVVAFNVWKMYSQLAFINKGSQNAKFAYKSEYEDYAMAARGHDAFPTEEELNRLSNKYSAPNYIIQRMMSTNSEVLSCKCLDLIETENPNEPIPEDPTENIKVYFGQLYGVAQNEMTLEYAQQIIDIYNDGPVIAFPFADISLITLRQAIDGYTYPYDTVGRYFFFIEEVEDNSIEIFDLLAQSMAPSLDKFYDSDNQRLIFFSQFYISPSNIYFKFLYDAG